MVTKGTMGPEDPASGEPKAQIAPAALSGDAASNPLREYQWHLDGYLTPGGNPYGANIDAASLDYTGRGVRVGIIDEGFDLAHADLAGRFNLSLSYDPRDTGTIDIRPDVAEQWHGTAVAGMIGASADNAFGTVGVASGASLVGFFARFGMAGSPRAELIDLLARAGQTADVVNNSWGYTGQFADNFQSSVWSPFRDALVNGVTEGRDGLGTLYVFAAGNDRQYVSNSLTYDGDNTNYHGLTNSRFVTTVAATTEDGEIAPFSTPGASILVAAPGASVLTTTPTNGDDNAANDYGFVSGTSFAAPIVSGVIALMLEANPHLGYRDVQEILTLSSRKTDADSPAWATNGTSNWNGGANLVSHDVGFGLVDAHAAVRLAETWTTSHTADNEAMIAISGTLGGNATLTDGVPNDYAVTVGAGYANFSIDWVEVDISVLHSHIGDLVIELVSPTGTRSVLLDRPQAGNNPRDDLSFTFSTTHDWGESPVGAWHVIVTDLGTGGTGQMVSFSLRFFGDDQGTDRSFYYTDEFATVQGDRTTLTGTAGLDTVNAAAITSALSLDLNAGATSTIAGRQVTTGSAAVIENAYGGDGNDTLIGNGADNHFSGGRGDDTLEGRNGNDVLFGGQGTDTLIGGIGDDTYVVDAVADIIVENADQGIDTIRTNLANYLLPDNIENLIAGHLSEGGAAPGVVSNALTGNNLDNAITGGSGDDTLDGGFGSDTAHYSSSRANYRITEIAPGLFQVTDLRPGSPDGTDTLTGIEYLSFLDRTVTMADALNTAPVIASNGGGAAATTTILENTRAATTVTATDPLGGTLTYTIVGGADAARFQINAASGALSFITAPDFEAPADANHDNRYEVVVRASNGLDFDQQAITVEVTDAQGLLLFGNGNVTLAGSAEDDAFRYQNGTVTVDGKTGTDSLDFSGFGSAVWVNLASNGPEGWTMDRANVTSGAWRAIAEVSNVENLVGTAYDDLLRGSSGDNSFIYMGGLDAVDGMGGNDTIDFSRLGAAVYVDLANRGIEAWTRDNAGVTSGTWRAIADLAGIETVVGTDYADDVRGDAGNNRLMGGDGDDLLSGRGGNDVIDGGAGTDTAVFANRIGSYSVSLNGSDIVVTGEGTDRVVENVEIFRFADATLSRAQLVAELTPAAFSGNADSVALSRFGGTFNALGGDDVVTYRGGFVTVDGGAGSDTLDFAGFASAVWVTLGVSGPDGWTLDRANLIGGAWRAIAEVSNVENIVGTAYDDFLRGNGSDNTFTYTGGLDTVDGMGGTDTIDFSRFGSAVFVDLATRGVEAWTRDNAGITSGAWRAIADLAGIETVVGTGYADDLRGDGNANRLVGGGGSDSLNGGAGNDRLDGGAGSDLLTGGTGSDLFVFVTPGEINGDRITDFQSVVGQNTGDTLVIQGSYSAIVFNNGSTAITYGGVTETIFHPGVTLSLANDVLVI